MLMSVLFLIREKSVNSLIAIPFVL